MLGNSELRRDLNNMKAGVKVAFDAVKDEMSNHLDSINQNTEEIQLLYDFISQVEAKIDKLGERMDQIDMIVNPWMRPLSGDVHLSKAEKEVFMVLYTAQRKVTAVQMAKALGLTEEIVLKTLHILAGKGVPLMKESMGGEVFLSINPRFKDLQAKRNMLKIEESIAKKIPQI